MDTYKVILYLNNSLLFICAVIGLVRYKFFKNTEKWYAYYIIFLFLIEAVVKLCLYVFNLRDVNFVFPFYVAGELLLLGILYIRKLNMSVYWYIPVVLLAALFFTDSQMLTSDVKKVISNIVVICFAGYALLTEIKSSKINGRFMIADSFIFLYYALSVFLFFLLRQLSDLGKEEANMIWSINNILSSFLYISMIYTFLRLKK
ncbi:MULTISPECIES: hypothetical protein [unclassified Chryseobacterium]|uniref:hypothetical protein n=1 Tax=unclassified Chryseobacterium TaxID=2593645 RepID=UPI0021E56D3A|nr:MULTISPECIES: hypothetical protein [unclassified Chryseobacterium]MEC5172056.1 hypothetical protein [Chryseobacterium nepalense]